MGFLWKCCSIKGPPQSCRGEFRGLHGVMAGSLGFLLSCMSTRGSAHVSSGKSDLFGVGKGPSGFLAHHCRVNRASSRVEAGTSGFLSISEINLRVSVELEQGSQASSCVEPRNSACLSSCSWDVRPLVELYLEPAAFSGGYNWGVSAPSCCDFILVVTFEEVPGHRDLP